MSAIASRSILPEIDIKKAVVTSVIATVSFIALLAALGTTQATGSNATTMAAPIASHAHSPACACTACKP